jgi:hypothetical protein
MVDLLPQSFLHYGGRGVASYTSSPLRKESIATLSFPSLHAVEERVEERRLPYYLLLNTTR